MIITTNMTELLLSLLYSSLFSLDLFSKIVLAQSETFLFLYKALAN